MMKGDNQLVNIITNVFFTEVLLLMLVPVFVRG